MKKITLSIGLILKLIFYSVINLITSGSKMQLFN